jgi:mono/diheme cytochrome c family protein
MRFNFSRFRRTRRFQAAGVLLVGFILVGCGIQTSSEPEIVSTRVIRAPTATPQPDPNLVFDVQSGAQLFAENCAPCHGETGLGDGPVAASFTCQMPALAQRADDVVLTDWFYIILNGIRENTDCLMPPWGNRLNAAQIWNVAAYALSLRYDTNQQAVGQVLWETTCASCHNGETADALTDSLWQSNTTDAAILAALNDASIEGHDFVTPISAGDERALLVYVRTRSYGATQVVAAPDATQEPGEVEASATEEPGQAAPSGTEEPIDTTSPSSTQVASVPTGEAFTISGAVTNGTAGGSVPPDLTLVLRLVGLDESGQPQDLYRAEAALDANGLYTFANVPRYDRAILSIETTYAGIRQFSERLLASAIESSPYDLPFTIYETTDDPAAISISYMETLVDAVTIEQASLTYINYEFMNSGDRAYIGQNGRTLALRLPDGAVGGQVDAFANTPGRFQSEQDGSQTVFYDTFPVFPGVADRIVVSYNKFYDGSMDIEQAFDYDVQQYAVYISDTRGLRLESDQLRPIESADLNGITYAGFGSREALSKGGALRYRVFDGPNVVRAAGSTQESGEDESFLRENTTLILGLGILLVVAGAVYLFYDLQKTRLLAQQAGAGRAKVAPLASREELVAQIAALDETYEAGKLSEAEYERQREALKDALRRQLE